jgi:Transposase DNA-binding/Transposase DDE domain
MSIAVPPSFGQIHFAGLDLGDARVNRRIVDLADLLVAAEAESWPDKFADPADYRAFQRLVNRPQATHASVRDTHTRRTRDRMAAAPVVLVLHDTTELDYTGRAIPALGPIGNGRGRGWLCHNSLAVDPGTGAVLGLANQILRRRVAPGVARTETVEAKRARGDRESRLWWDGVQGVGPTRPGCTWVQVCDRGADTFEFLQHLSTAGYPFVIRSQHNRAVTPDGEQPNRVHDRLRALPAQAGWRGVARTDAGRSREVKLQGCWATVTLVPPRVRRGDRDPVPVTVTAIRVWEVETPVGEPPVEWVLLTNGPVADVGAMRTVVGYYQRRPIIEEYHKALKSGCGVERLQQRTGPALQAAIGITAVLAVALLELRDRARDPGSQDQPAAALVGERAVRVLSVWRLGAPEPNWTVKAFVWALGRLGGHMNRPSDGPPGWQTLWRGLRKLRAMIDYDKKAIPTCGTR